MEQTILERLVSDVYVCLERFLGFPIKVDRTTSDISTLFVSLL